MEQIIINTMEGREKDIDIYGVREHVCLGGEIERQRMRLEGHIDIDGGGREGKIFLALDALISA